MRSGSLQGAGPWGGCWRAGGTGACPGSPWKGVGPRTWGFPALVLRILGAVQDPRSLDTQMDSDHQALFHSPCTWSPVQPASWLPQSHANLANVLFWVLEVTLRHPARALGLCRYGFVSWLVSHSPVPVLSPWPEGQHLSLAGRLAVSLAGVPPLPRLPLLPSRPLFEPSSATSS